MDLDEPEVESEFLELEMMEILLMVEPNQVWNELYALGAVGPEMTRKAHKPSARQAIMTKEKV